MMKGTSSNILMDRNDCEDKEKHSTEVGDVGEKEDDISIELLLGMSGIFSKLPSDIFLDILSRVPLKSLSQCRWVSKSWYHLIKHPRFVKIHYEWARANSSPCAILCGWDKEFYLVDHQVFDCLETSATVQKLNFNEIEQVFKAGEFYKVYEVVGSINGLICFSSDSSFYFPSPYYICNPITGEHITLPKSPKQDIAPFVSAFAYASTTNEYKVIRLLQNEDNEEEIEQFLRPECEVYTLGSNEWRSIEDVPNITYRRPAVLNGNIYWLSHENVESLQSLIIVVFDVATEKFYEIPPPPCVFPSNNLILKRLWVLEEHLCFIHEGASFRHYEIWVMKDNGMQASWVKQYSFKEKSKTSWFMNGSYDLTKLRNGEFLLHYGGERRILGYYDPKNETHRHITVHNQHYHDEDYFHPIILVASLISPKNIGQVIRRSEDLVNEKEFQPQEQ